MRTALAAVLCFLSVSSVFAQDLVDLGGPDGEYHYKVLRQGGKIVRVTGPLSVHKPVPPDGSPPTTNPPTESALSKSVRQYTASALSKGGSPETAAKLAVIYSLVSVDCSDLPGKPAKLGMPQLSSQLIAAATDEILKGIPAGEKVVWEEWRAALRPLLTAVPGIGTDKVATATALDQVAEGIQGAINSAAVAEPGILDRINWETIKQLLMPILQRLLEQLIDDLLKKLPM